MAAGLWSGAKSDTSAPDLYNWAVMGCQRAASCYNGNKSRERGKGVCYEICHGSMFRSDMGRNRCCAMWILPLESGKIYGLLGRNGAAKPLCSTASMGISRRDSGNFFIIEDDNRRNLKPEDIGYVLSTPTVPEFLTGREFLKFSWISMKRPFATPGRWMNTLTG